MAENPIDWSKCDDVESVPGRVSGAWVIKGTRVEADAVVENARAGCSGPKKSPAPISFRPSPLDTVRRVLRFAKLTPPSNG